MKFARERALNVNVSFDYWLLLTLFSTQLHFPVAILSPQVDFFMRKFTVKYVFIHVSMYIYLIYIDNDALYFLHRITPLSNMSGWKWGTTSMFVLDFVTYVCANAYTVISPQKKLQGRVTRAEPALQNVGWFRTKIATWTNQCAEDFDIISNQKWVRRF